MNDAPVESSLIQLRDDNLANVEIDAGDASAEAPLGSQATELTSNDAIEQSAAVAGTEPQQTAEVQVAEEQTTKSADADASTTEAAATEAAVAEALAAAQSQGAADATTTEAAATETTTEAAATTTKAGDGIGSDSAEVKETAKKFAQM